MFLSVRLGMVAVIMLRILHRDLTRYNNEQLSEEEAKEETGWKLIHGDVFRPPQHGAWLSVLVGTGVQVFAMTLVTLIFAALGFLSPANRGGLMSALLLLFVFMGTVAGYWSTRLYKMFQLTEWRMNTLITALFFPGLMFSVFFILNLFVWHEKSSGAVPFGTLVSLLVLWLGISVPLVYLGSYIAFRKPVVEHPVSRRSSLGRARYRESPPLTELCSLCLFFHAAGQSQQSVPSASPGCVSVMVHEPAPVRAAWWRASLRGRVH